MMFGLRCHRSSSWRVGLFVATGLAACVVDENLQIGDDATATSGGTGTTATSSVGSVGVTSVTETLSATHGSASTGADVSTTSGSPTTDTTLGVEESTTSGDEERASSEVTDSAEATTAGDLCADLSTPIGSCCWTDEACQSGQRCYSANCEAQIPGRCATPPPEGCYDDRDCGADERCVYGQLASCNSLAPDAVGTCEPNCDYDSCHPERCDEPGEPCCDPLPSDGPNYCNEGLVCGPGGCEAPTFCGAIVCAPGEFCCDRCEDRCQPLVQSSPCVEDERPEAFVCDAAMAAFSCGEETCASTGTQYCELSTSGDGVMTQACHDSPSSCVGHSSCACLLRAGAITMEHTCMVGQGGELIVMPPPSP